MLIYGIKIAILASLSMVMAFFSYKALFNNEFGRKILIFSFAMLPFLFFQNNEMVRAVAFLICTYLLAKNANPNEAVGFFIATIGLMPDWSRYLVSLPGIETLVILFFWKVGVIVLLAPYMTRLNKFPSMKLNMTDIFLCLFVIYVAIIKITQGNLSFTQLLRYFTDEILLYIIPYFVISRVIHNFNGFSYALLGFLTLAVLQSCYFFFSQLSQIDIYNSLNPYQGVFASIREYRGGFLRLAGSLNGVLTGYLIASSLLILFALKRFFPINNFQLIALVTLFLLAILFGGSRGALFSVGILLAVYFYVEKFGTFGRIFILLLSIICVVAYYSFDLSQLLSYEDEYGTFDFRAELHTAAFEFLKVYPLFGRLDYLNSGMFDHMWRGTGIIDIVSVYLEIVLPYGLIGLLLFIGMFLSIIFPLLNLILFNGTNNKEIKNYAAIILSMIFGYLFLISTTSSQSLIMQYGIILIALGRSMVSRRYQTNPS